MALHCWLVVYVFWKFSGIGYDINEMQNFVDDNFDYFWMCVDGRFYNVDDADEHNYI